MWSLRPTGQAPKRGSETANEQSRTRAAHALAHHRARDADRQIAGLVAAGHALQLARRGHLGNACQQRLGRRGPCGLGTGAIAAVIGEQLGAAVAQLPAMRGLMINALDALRHRETSAREDRNFSWSSYLPLLPLDCSANATALPATMSLGIEACEGQSPVRAASPRLAPDQVRGEQLHHSQLRATPCKYRVT